MKKFPPRQALRWILTVALVFPVSTLASQALQSWATSIGLDQRLLSLSPSLVAGLAALTHRLWFWPCSAALGGAAVTAWVTHLLPKTGTWVKEDVECHLFFSAQGNATLKLEKNVRRWHILPRGVVTLGDSQGNIIATAPTDTIVILIYCELVAARQFHVELEGHAPPRFEVKDNNAYGCVLLVEGNLNGSLLKLRVEV